MQAEEPEEIEIRRLSEADPMAFEVIVSGANDETRHQVTLARADFWRMAEQYGADDLIEAAFRFLLDREPKEQILRRFDISVIARYFPDFEQELPRYLSQL